MPHTCAWFNGTSPENGTGLVTWMDSNRSLRRVHTLKIWATALDCCTGLCSVAYLQQLVARPTAGCCALSSGLLLQTVAQAISCGVLHL